MRVIEEAAADGAQTPHGARAEEVRTQRHEGTVRRVHPFVEWAGGYAWRLLAIGLAVAALVWLLGQVLVVVVPVAVALLLTRALAPVYRWLRRRNWRPALAALATVLGFLIVLGAILAVVGSTFVNEFDELGPTITEGIDEIERWLVEDSPFDINQSDIDNWRERAGEALSRFVQANQSSLTSGAVLVAEVAVGAVLALIVTFFLLKDGRRIFAKTLLAVPPDRRDRANRMATRAWDSAGGYLRGAAILGIVESIAIGIALLIVGASLVGPVMVLTFLAAFIPIVGAIVAGIVAVLVALVTAGPAQALIVAAIALVVQQLDNDVLAPVVYGRALRLHPLVILLGVAAGGALFGFIGTLFAVPALAVGLNVLDEARRHGSSDTAPALPELAADDHRSARQGGNRGN